VTSFSDRELVQTTYTRHFFLPSRRRLGSSFKCVARVHLVRFRKGLASATRISVYCQDPRSTRTNGWLWRIARLGEGHLACQPGLRPSKGTRPARTDFPDSPSWFGPARRWSRSYRQPPRLPKRGRGAGTTRRNGTERNINEQATTTRNGPRPSGGTRALPCPGQAGRLAAWPSRLRSATTAESGDAAVRWKYSAWQRESKKERRTHGATRAPCTKARRNERGGESLGRTEPASQPPHPLVLGERLWRAVWNEACPEPMPVAP
jgi:hypothetical protein